MLHLYKSYKENACNEPKKIKSYLNELEYKFGINFNYYVEYSDYYIDICVNMPNIYLLKNVVYYISYDKIDGEFVCGGNIFYIHIKKKYYIFNVFGTIIKINKKLINKPLPCLYNKFMYLYNNKNIFFTTKINTINEFIPIKKFAYNYYNRNIDVIFSCPNYEFYSIYKFYYIYDNFLLYKTKYINNDEYYIDHDFDCLYTYISNSHIILLFI